MVWSGFAKYFQEEPSNAPTRKEQKAAKKRERVRKAQEALAKEGEENPQVRRGRSSGYVSGSLLYYVMSRKQLDSVWTRRPEAGGVTTVVRS